MRVSFNKDNAGSRSGGEDDISSRRAVDDFVDNAAGQRSDLRVTYRRQSHECRVV